MYIIFTIADVMETLACAEQKANKLLGELDAAKGVGLIERIRRGLGKPNVIYVKNFIAKPQIPPGRADTPEPPDPPIRTDLEGSPAASRRAVPPKQAVPTGQEAMPVQKMLQEPAGESASQGILQGHSESQIQNCENHRSGIAKITNK